MVVATETQYEPTEQEVRDAVAKLLEQKGKRVEYQKKRNELLANDPEAMKKVREARKTYNQSEKSKERRKKYYDMNKDKIYAAHKKYQEKRKILLAKAKEMGLIPTKGAA